MADDMWEMPDYRAQFAADYANVMRDDNDNREEEAVAEQVIDPALQPNNRICEARQMLFRMFRRRVWRYQQNTPTHRIEGGIYPENLQTPHIPDAAHLFLLQAFNRKNRISPTRCIRLSRQTGLLPMVVCDYFLDLNYPTLRQDLARRRSSRRRPRTFIYNLYVNFKVEVHRVGAAPGPNRRPNFDIRQ